MSKRYCNTCRWYDLDYAFCGNCQSEEFGEVSRVIDCCDCYEEYNSDKYNDYWKHEAQLNAAAAGELKISIAEYLEEVRVRKTALIRQFTLEDHDFDRVILQWKIKQLQQYIDRLEAILYGQGSTANY